jgi:hypothetical protein
LAEAWRLASLQSMSLAEWYIGRGYIWLQAIVFIALVKKSQIFSFFCSSFPG